MTALKGYISDGAIVAEDAVPDSYDGKEVIITILDKNFGEDEKMKEKKESAQGTSQRFRLNDARRSRRHQKSPHEFQGTFLMLYMLDTNIVSYLLEKNQNVVNRFDDIFLENEIKISNIVHYEIQRGIFYRQSNKLQHNFDISDADFLQAARIYADLRQKGKLIEDADILSEHLLYQTMRFL